MPGVLTEPTFEPGDTEFGGAETGFDELPRCFGPVGDDQRGGCCAEFRRVARFEGLDDRIVKCPMLGGAAPDGLLRGEAGLQSFIRAGGGDLDIDQRPALFVSAGEGPDLPEAACLGIAVKDVGRLHRHFSAGLLEDLEYSGLGGGCPLVIQPGAEDAGKESDNEEGQGDSDNAATALDHCDDFAIRGKFPQ